MSTTTVKCASKFGPDRCRIHGNKSPLSTLRSSIQANANLYVTRKQLKDVSNWDSYVENKELLEHDQLVYDATLTGQVELKRKIEKMYRADDPERYDEYKARHQAAEKYRAEQLANDPTTATRLAEFNEKLESVTKYVYPDTESILLNYKQIDSVPDETPVAFILKDGSTLIARSSDGITKGYNNLTRFEKIGVRPSFLPVYRFAKPSKDDIAHADFALKLAPGVRTRISVSDVAELRVLNDDAFDNGIEAYKNSNETSPIDLADQAVHGQSEYFRAEGPDYLYEGEAIRSDSDSYGWHVDTRRGIRSTWLSFNPETTKLNRIVLPETV